MLKTYIELQHFRDNLIWHNSFDFYDAYEEISCDKSDEDIDGELYEKIEQVLLNWVKENAKHDVYYRGDLQFEFESEEDRDRLDAECGDPVAFKLTWS